MLIEYGVESNSILNSPLTFRMNLNKMENLLKELKSISIEPISSWMLTCNETQLNAYVEDFKVLMKIYTHFDCVHLCRMIKRQEKQKELLNGCTNAIDFIAKRLHWDEETKGSVLKSCPALVKCNISKVFIFL